MNNGPTLVHYQNNAAYFIHPTALGSTSQVTGDTGAMAQDELHYPWGQEWAMAGTLQEGTFRQTASSRLGDRDRSHARQDVLLRPRLLAEPRPSTRLRPEAGSAGKGEAASGSDADQGKARLIRTSSALRRDSANPARTARTANPTSRTNPYRNSALDGLILLICTLFYQLLGQEGWVLLRGQETAGSVNTSEAAIRRGWRFYQK